jgi:hypothetical protein
MDAAIGQEGHPIGGQGKGQPCRGSGIDEGQQALRRLSQHRQRDHGRRPHRRQFLAGQPEGELAGRWVMPAFSRSQQEAVRPQQTLGSQGDELGVGSDGLA